MQGQQSKTIQKARLISKFQPTGDHLTEEKVTCYQSYMERKEHASPLQLAEELQVLCSFSFLLWQYLCLTKPSLHHHSYSHRSKIQESISGISDSIYLV